MSSVFTAVGSGNHVGETIGDDILGINMRSHHNRTHEGSAFREVMEQFDTHSLRFPGGTITEEHFDITDPNATRTTNVMHLIHPHLIPARTNGVPVERTVTPLSDYLDYVNELGVAPSIVLPTYRLFDQSTRGLTASGENDIRTFVRELFSDEYGEVDTATIEIGNEYFQFFRFNWSIDEFGRFQAQIAQIIDDELRDMGLREDLTLLAQGGHVRNNNTPLTNSNNAELAQHFQGLPEGTVDGVTLHFYGTRAAGTNDPLNMVPNIPGVVAGTNAIWGPVIGQDFEIAVTEWNVGEDGPDSTTINATMRTAPLLNMFAEMVESGVDAAHLWAARVDDPAGLAMRSEDASELTPTGHFFDMLSESTRGLNLVDPGNDYLLRNTSGTHVGYTYTFESADRSVVYFVSGSGQSVSLNAELSSLMREGTQVQVRTLSTAPGDALNGYLSDAQVSEMSLVQLERSPDGSALFEAELGPYALIELHINHKLGALLEGNPEQSTDDMLNGSSFDDDILGYKGNDTLNGEGGDDMLKGGFGADMLMGDAGADTMLGGNGHDDLWGGDGQDQMHGGKGNDLLHGGDDDDRMFGELGLDQLFGEGGNDVLFGGRGADSLFGGEGDDALTGGNSNDALDGGAGADELFGGNGGDVLDGGDGDDALNGGNGSDTLDGGAGNDVLTGGNGSDVLQGGAGDDALSGNNGTDLLQGGDGADVLQGGRGADDLQGGAGDDSLSGDQGADRLNGGAGNDVLTGGRGADIFTFSRGGGHDQVTDFMIPVDRVDLTEFDLASFGEVLEHAHDTDAGLVLDFDQGESMTLSDVLKETLNEDNFLI